MGNWGVAMNLERQFCCVHKQVTMIPLLSSPLTQTKGVWLQPNAFYKEILQGGLHKSEREEANGKLNTWLLFYYYY